MKKTTIIFGILAIVTLVGGVVLVNQNQEMRKGAAFANTSLMLLPSEKIVKNVDDTLSIHLQYTTESGAKLYNVDTVVCYGPELELSTTESTGNVDLGYGAPMIIDAAAEGSNKCSRVIALKETSKINVAAASGEVAVLKFRAVSAGSGSISLDKDKSKATGENPNSETDKWITVTTVTGTSYDITGASTGTGLLLKFNMTFLGVTAGAGCAEPADMPLAVIVRAADGITKTYNNVVATKLSGDQNGLGIYQVVLRLGDFNYGSNLAVFVKDGRHLQVKYGVNGQSAFYNQAGGELGSLTSDEATTSVIDFTKYPLLAGDVTGPDGVQDGVVDGLDFSYVKTQSIARTAIDAGGYMLADLNGNCKMESQDLSELMLSLNERQGQLY